MSMIKTDLSLKPLIFAGRSGKDFAAALAKRWKTTVGSNETITFSDGNIFVQLKEKVRHREVVVVQSLAGARVDSDFLELAFYLDAAKRAGASQITAIVPYFSYAKADKHDGVGTSLRARVCADMLQAAGLGRVMMMDLHSPSIPGFFNVSVEHLKAMGILGEAVKKMRLPKLVVVSPDAGFAKTARSYAAYFKADCVICDKNRADHSERPNIVEVIGDVKGKSVVIFDDFTTSGGTLIEVSRVLLSRGAATVMAAVSHAPVTKETLRKISNSSLSCLITTNSVAGVGKLAAAYPKVKVLDASGMFAEAY